MSHSLHDYHIQCCIACDVTYDIACLALWKLLEQYRIPTFLFINKMDRPGTDARSLLLELRHRLHGGCIDFGRPEGDELFYEDAALTDEDVMEDFLLTGRVEDAVIVRLIRERKIFPCYFGSALKEFGVDALIGAGQSANNG